MKNTIITNTKRQLLMLCAALCCAVMWGANPTAPDISAVNETSYQLTVNSGANGVTSVTYFVDSTDEIPETGDTRQYSVIEGVEVSFTFTPSSEYSVGSVTVDGVDVTASLQPGMTSPTVKTYTLAPMSADVTVQVTYAKNYTDGEVFTAQTIEGVNMDFKVISAADMTCQVGDGSHSSIADGVTVVTVPSVVNGFTVTTVGSKAFWRGAFGALTTVTLPSTITSIGNNAFESCGALTAIVIPEAVTTIGDNAFLQCIDLASVTMPPTITYIGESAFKSTPSLTSIELPTSITTISAQAFYSSGLTSITIPEGVTSIGESAFNSCSSLATVNFPTSLLTIGKEAFSLNSALTAINLPSQLQTIGESAFGNCELVTSITIPASVTTIESWGLSINNLKWVTVEGTTPPTITENSFTGSTTGYGVLYVQQDAIDTYHASEYWNVFNRIYAIGKHPYAVLDGNTLTFYCNDQRDTYAEPFELNFTSINNSPLYGHKDEIVNVVFDDSFADFTELTSTASWFYDCGNLTSISGLEKVNTSKVTNMEYMFDGCRSLTSLDISNFDLSSVQKMYCMFRRCSGLTNINLGNFNASSTTSFSQMFQGCTSLETINISDANTSSATTMYAMFNDCRALTELNLGSFNTANVTDMSMMFANCNALKTIYVGSGWTTAAVTDNGTGMFSDCNNLEGGAGTTWASMAAANVENCNNYQFAHIDGGTSNPGYLTDVADYGKVEEPYAVLSDENTKLTFYYDKHKEQNNGMDVNFTDNTLRGWNSSASYITEVVFDPSFANCTTLTSTAWLFWSMGNLTTITGIENLKTDNVTNMHMMFNGCSKLTSLDVSSFKTDNVVGMYGMFSECTGLTSLDLSSFNTASATDMGYMFFSNVGLKTIYVGNGWSTNAVTSSDDMFTGCTALVGGEGTTYDASHVDAGYAHIDEGPSNPGYLTLKGGYVEAPTFTWNADELTMTSGTEGATIYYTLSDAEELIPATYFESTVASGIPEGFIVHYSDEDRVAPNTYSAGPRMMTYNEGGDFTRALYFREGYVLYGTAEGYGLSMKAGNKYNIQFNTMMWKDNGKYMKFEVIDEADNVLYSEIIENEKNIDGATDVVVSDSKKVLVNFTPEADGNYKLKWTAIDADGNQAFNEVMLAKVTVNSVNYIIPATQYTAPITVTSDVLIEAYAEKDGMARSMTTTLNYPYTAWMQLITAIADAQNVLAQANTNDNVTAEQRDSLVNFINTAQGMYEARIDSAAAITQFTTDLTTLTETVRQAVEAIAEPYAVLSDNGIFVDPETGDEITAKTLTFYYDKQKEARNGMDIGPFAYLEHGFGESQRPWHDVRESITDVVFDSSMANDTTLISTGWWFYGCTNLKRTSGWQYLPTANIVDMWGMFENCSSLSSNPVEGGPDFSAFNTASLKRTCYLFHGCTSMTSIDLSTFNTANVTETEGMFKDCAALTTIYVGSGWTMTNVSGNWEDDMFSGSTSLVGGAGTTYDASNIGVSYAHIDGGISNPGYFTSIESLRRWDFTKWSSETIANLKADAANSKITGWSDVEKRADAEADSEPTEAAKDNCFWLDAETTDANGVAISELEGLVFDANYCSKRSLAIAVNYPSTSLGDYAGGAYLWLGGKNYDCFTIPNVKNGQTITIEVESHNASDARGITLIAGSTELESFTPTAKASYSWTITEDCDVIVRNTNGCHIYTITVEGAGIPTNSLEIYAVETNSTITPNQPIMATQSVVVTPGNDTEWGTKYSIGIDHDSQINTIEFVASIYYPNNTTSQVFNGSMYGTNNPRDGELVEGTSTGNSYKHYLKNLPHSGGYVVFEPLQDGSLIVPIHVNAEKQFYVVDGNGKALTDIQIKDANGQTLKLLASPLCAISTESTTTAFVSLNVKQGERYYMFCTGSKMRFGGYVFSKQSIEIDSTTMAGVKDLLESEPYAVLSEENTVLTFYYDKQKEQRGGMDIGEWDEAAKSTTMVVVDASFASYHPTSTVAWFAGLTKLASIEGMSNLKTDSVTNMWNMFGDCISLMSIDLSGLKTDKVENMGDMFGRCSGLTSLDVSNLNTENVNNMQGMFAGCKSLMTLDLSGFKTDNVSSMYSMFSECSSLKTIYVGDGWSTANNPSSEYMFAGCTSLVGGMGTVFDENHVDATYAHIDGGPSNPGYFTLPLSMGDANGDGNINIADAVATVTNILGQPTEATFYKYAADMNTDQVIDIFDVTLIVNAAFDAASPAPAMTRGSASNIMMEHISMTADADYIYLGIDQPERFTATQFDVTLPEGMELVDARLASATTDHQLTFVKRGNNEYRVIGLSMSNTTFRSMNGQLIKLEVSGSAVDSDVKMSNVLFVTPTATVMTSIDKCLNTAKMADDSLYDLKGQRLSKQQLGKGIYIMNHKKVIIK